MSQVNHAELRGQVYLYHWESGSRPIPGGKYVVMAGCLVPIPPLQAAIWAARLAVVVSYNIIRFRKNMRRADQMGWRLAKNLHKLKDSHRYPITLIGHSLGGRVVTSALCHVDAEKFNVRRAVLLAAAMEEPPNGYGWHDAARPIKRELVNVWSPKDMILYYLKPRIPGTLCVGSDPISPAPAKVRNKKCSLGHREYMEQLGYILDLAIRDRKRSENYTGQVYVTCPNEKCGWGIGVWPQAEVECPYCGIAFEYDPTTGQSYFHSFEISCPNERCGVTLEKIMPNEEYECEECGVEFEYDPATDQCYWEHSPKWVLCSYCEEEEIMVQDTGEYQCSYCRRWNDFERVGNTVYLA